MENCLFCQIAHHEIPSYTVYEDDEIIAFLDIFPIREGQVVVIPKEHTSSRFSKADPSLLAKTIQKAQKIAKLMEEKLGYEYTFVVVQGLGVMHLHIKLFPHFGEYEGEFTIPDHVDRASEESLEKMVKKLV